MAITDIILREVVYAPLATKGSALSNTELDENFINIFDEFTGVNKAGKLRAYSDAINFYIGDYTSYGNKTWRSLFGTVGGTPNIGHTPVEGTYWTEVFSSELIGDLVSNTINLTAHAGGGQANATILPFAINRIDNCATDLDSTKCFAATRGDRIIIINESTKTINHFPATGETILGTSGADQPIQITSGIIVELFCFVTGVWTIIATSATGTDTINGLSGYDENVLTSDIGTPTQIIKKSNCVVGTNGGLYLQAPEALPGREFWIQIDIGSTPGENINLLTKKNTEQFENQTVNTPFVMDEQEFWVFYCTKTGIWRVK